jgi:hypothetical protein
VLLPLLFLSLGYPSLIILELVMHSFRYGRVECFPGMVILMPLHHLAYALGFIWGLLFCGFKRIMKAVR